MRTEIVTFSNINTSITYFIGTNKSDNFKVIDISNKDDMWFHVSGCNSSCHVVAKISEILNVIKKKQLLTIIKKGALLCKQNTNRIQKEKNVEIMYTQVKNIIKTEKEGTVISNNFKIYTLSQ